MRALDGTRFVTSGVNGLLTVLDDLTASMAEEAGINTVMADWGEVLDQVGTSDLVTQRTAEVFATLDIAGMNYLESRYTLDRDLFPHRIIVGTETFPTHIDLLWGHVKRQPHVIGDFTWVGWDYLGEAGVGRPQYGDAPAAFLGDHPWLTAWCGDIDITGVRRPASYYREIVFGLRSTPYIAVQRPETLGRQAVSSPWAWTDSLASWTWPGHEGEPVIVEVYSDADEVELLLNGTSLGRRPVGEQHRYRTEFDVRFASGDLVAVAFRGGQETGRSTLRTATGTPVLAATADRPVIRADVDDLAFIDIALVDSRGVHFPADDRRVRVAVEGPGRLQGLGSGDPRNTESFTDDNHLTFNGRALAAIRPTGPGQIRVVVTDATGLRTDVEVIAEKTEETPPIPG